MPGMHVASKVKFKLIIPIVDGICSELFMGKKNVT